MDGNESLIAPTANIFTNKNFLQEIGYASKVHTVGKNLLGEWSDAVEVRTYAHKKNFLKQEYKKIS